ncbi:MAG: 50S ribosomal protein L4 [Candidatus Komeilibacteria bacterium]|nr:50S ribosomal protein L4 [Candidatus Komeilibacteria bacterium]
MVEAKLYNQAGDENGTIQLPESIFAVVIKPALIREVADILESQRRPNLAHVKTRSEVRGGGRKPWRQKGTGRARHGSIRSPLWRGGGVVFGPRNVINHSRKVNQKAKNLALKMVLTNKVQAGKLVVMENIDAKEGKTKDLAKVLTKLTGRSRTLVVMDSGKTQVVRAAKNIKRVTTLPASSLNVLDLLKNAYLLVTKPALDKIEKTYK